MKKIWQFLVHHLREDFNPKQYFSTAAFLVVCLSLNYVFDFEDNYLEPLHNWTKFYAYVIFYSIPYFTAIYIFAHFKNRMEIFSLREFWIKSLFGILLLSLDASMPYLGESIDAVTPARAQFWAFKVAVNGASFFTVFIPILVFYYVFEKNETHRYGLSAYKFDARPYFTMLLIMFPLIVAASFNASFTRQYPMYKVSSAHTALGIEEWITVAIYEIAYGLDFVTVEYLFRGFFVIAMSGLLGRGAVITMAVLYCVLHFGKPAGEAMSSIFGGFILGVVAYETKSVWGGIIVHMGIAWTMELVAFIKKSIVH